MFKQMKNIDTAFKYIRSFTFLIVSGSIALCSFAVYKSFSLIAQTENKVYILANGKVLEAYASERKENIAVEAKDHVKTFHQLFFTLDPDEKVIEANLTKALYLADRSAKRTYDNLKESGYFANVISGNISQKLITDSVKIDTQVYPYPFTCYATQKIIRTTSIVSRSLITKGYLRTVSRSDNNPHGFLIEHWETLENKDLKIENR